VSDEFFSQCGENVILVQGPILSPLGRESEVGLAASFKTGVMDALSLAHESLSACFIFDEKSVEVSDNKNQKEQRHRPSPNVLQTTAHTNGVAYLSPG
jgi:hypothetical protein